VTKNVLAKHYRTAGLTIIELLVAIVVLGALLAIAIPRFVGYISQTEVSTALQDLRVLDNQLKAYKLNNDVYPSALSAVPQGTKLDPWGHPYEYLLIEGNPSAKNDVRKDKNLHPLNSDFDLYSIGKDGKTNRPLTAKASHDDIIRANDGGYYGVASNY